MRGLTGLVKFDRDGFRSNIQLDIVQLTENGLVKIGVWNSTSSHNVNWFHVRTKTDVELSLQNETFVVLISLTKPYGMRKESGATLSGNDRYEGFGIDIIQQISEILGFNYTLQVETNYGKLDDNTGKWSGMLGKIIDEVSTCYKCRVIIFWPSAVSSYDSKMNFRNYEIRKPFLTGSSSGHRRFNDHGATRESC